MLTGGSSAVDPLDGYKGNDILLGFDGVNVIRGFTGTDTKTVVLTLNDGTDENTITINGAGGNSVTIDVGDFCFPDGALIHPALFHAFFTR